MTTSLHRHRFGLALIAAIALVAAVWPALATAQSPGPGIGGPRVDTGVRGDAPSPGGIGLMVASRD
jgi:hypothetical protein